MGTSVVSGTARLLVCRTGSATAIGEIAHALNLEPPPTAFELGTRRFGMLIMRLTVLMVLFVLMVNTLTHKPLLESFLFAIALAVGLTPELLPMVVSVTLARGALRMAGKHVIVKRLAAIQNLGSMDVLCTDKTGTLTEAKISLERHVDICGADSARVLELAYLNSSFETGLKSPLDEAILAHDHLDVSRWKKIDEAPFDFERRRVSVLVDDGATRVLVVKGAPEDILRLSTEYEAAGRGDRAQVGRRRTRGGAAATGSLGHARPAGTRHRFQAGRQRITTMPGVQRRDGARARRLCGISRSAQGGRRESARGARRKRRRREDRHRRQRAS